MKFNILTEWRCNEVELFAWASTVLFGALFLVVAFWDNIAGVQISHHQGYGWRQIVAMAVFGLFAVWGMLIGTKWGE